MGAPEPVSPFHTEDLISDVSSSTLLSHFKNRYHGTARLGIEAMELRVRGYSCADMEENDLGYIVDYKRYDAGAFTGAGRRAAAVFQFHSAALRRLNKAGCQRYEGDYTRLKQKYAERRARRMAG